MINIDILIPVSDNEGETFTQEHHLAFERVILDHFEGFSRPFGVALGGWKDPTGKVYRDLSITYRIAVPSITAAASLAKIIDFAKAHYRQLSIFVSYLGLSEVL